MTTIEIRPMTPDDIPQVYSIEKMAYPDPWTTGIFNDCLKVGYRCFAMENENEVLGYSISSVSVEESHLLNINIKPERQNQGLGTQLMAFILEDARQLSAKTIFLEVRETNHPAITLYKKLGFQKVGSRKDYYPTQDGRENATIFRFGLD